MNSSPTHSFHLFSPLLQQRPSPLLSPFPHPRKISEDLSDLICFKLEAEPLSMNFPDCDPPSLSQANQLFNKHQAFSLGQQLNAPEAEDEVPSPSNSHRCDMPSTRFHSPKEEQQPPFLLLSEEDVEPSIRSMIQFLVYHSQLREDVLLAEGRRFYELGNGAEQAFKILSGKFRRLKKTKEELTKYCMRKAFKYVSDKGKKDGSGRGLEGSMRRYFADQDDADTFSVPFKKNSAEKTMNGNFLRRVFGCPRFASDYHDFLNEFGALIEEDNARKIEYLSKLIEETMKQGNMGKIQSMRRLPWTVQILQQTKQLAASLPEEGNGRRAKRPE